MRLFFPGTKGEIEEESPEHRFHSSLLIYHKNTRLVIDLGEKHSPELGGNLKKFDSMLITHAHPDHYIWTKRQENTISIPVYLMGIKWFGSIGVPLGVSFSSILQVVVLYALWNRRSRNIDSPKVYRHMGKMILLSLFLGCVLELFRRMIHTVVDPWTFQGAVFTGLSLGLLFLALLYLAGKMLRIEEIMDVLSEPMRRIRERRLK